MPNLKIRVSGVAWLEACDPEQRETPRDEHWPEPTATRVGKGWRYTYEGDETLARQIAEQLESVASALEWSDVSPHVIAACRRDAKRIRATLRKDA